MNSIIISFYRKYSEPNEGVDVWNESVDENSEQLDKSSCTVVTVTIIFEYSHKILSVICIM